MNREEFLAVDDVKIVTVETTMGTLYSRTMTNEDAAAFETLAVDVRQGKAKFVDQKLESVRCTLCDEKGALLFDGVAPLEARAQLATRSAGTINPLAEAAARINNYIPESEEETGKN